MTRSPFKPFSVREILERIPNDGCMLVFNAPHRNWRAKASDTGVLHVYTLQPSKEKVSPRKGSSRGRKHYDIYICFKEDCDV